MTNKFMVSQSKVKTFRRCHAAYDFRYVEKLRRKRKSRPLQFGTMIHESLERHFNGDEAMDYFEEIRADVKAMKLFAQERDEFGDIVNDTEDIIESYIDYWDGHDLRPIRKARRGAEHTFEIELFEDVVWNGKIDAIAKTSNGLRWLVEHKTYTRRPNDDDRWRNLQSVTYFRANDIMGWKPLDGALWDYVRSKAPATPHLLSDGSVSGKKLDSLPSTIRRHVSKKEKNFGKLISDAEKNQNQYFQRIHTPVNSAVAELVFEDFEATIKDMVKNHGHCRSMNIDKHCSWCDYEPICRAKLQGLDVDFVKEREYIDGKKNPRDKSKDKPVVHTVEHSEVLKHQNS